MQYDTYASYTLHEFNFNTVSQSGSCLEGVDAIADTLRNFVELVEQYLLAMCVPPRNSRLQMPRWPGTRTSRPRCVAHAAIQRMPLALRTRFHSSEQIFSSVASGCSVAASRVIRRSSPFPISNLQYYLHISSTY